MTETSEPGGLLSGMSADAARAANEALESLLARLAAGRATGASRRDGATLDWLVEAVAAALRREAGAGRRTASVNEIAAAIARAARKGARFT